MHFFLRLLLSLAVLNKLAVEGYIGNINSKCASWQVQREPTGVLRTQQTVHFSHQQAEGSH